MSDWLLKGLNDRAGQHQGPHTEDEKPHSWWKVMCLTGVDYFSTLGYQPGIAALAAGVLSPVATLVLVLVTLLGALPVYRRVAADSPHGAGSIAMLMKLLSFWKGKLFVLALLGFAATDFIITITLSAADATAHIDENPYVPEALRGQEVAVTLVLIALLGAVFLKGFTEAIGIAVGLVGVYLALNVVVIGDGLWRVLTHPTQVTDWTTALTTQHGDPLMMVAVALLIFPKLALGLSGFETGVAVMPQVKGDLRERVRNTKKLLTTAAVIMSCFLLTSSVVTTVLIPQDAFEAGGEANGRALAFLAHENLGNAFGTVYDMATIAILWFAGASAMAGLLNLVPRYLPKFGMAPAWARAVRPLVLVFTLTAFLITVIFQADVDAQGGAYATGVLVLMTSAAVAVTLSAHHRGQRRRTWAFGAIAVVFLYTTVVNVFERPDGVRIAACFIAAILVISLLSRVLRAFELRTTAVTADETATVLLDACARRNVRFIANEPGRRDAREYSDKIAQIIADNDLADDRDLIFVEVTVKDASDFESELRLHGEVLHHRYKILTVESSSVPSALAALLLHVRDPSGRRPHIYFEWTEGNPVGNFVRYLIFGQGEVAPVTREMVRRAEPDRRRRPHIHVG